LRVSALYLYRSPSNTRASNPAERFDLRRIRLPIAPGIFFISIFSREVCNYLQTKTARIMRDTRASNANKDGIFSDIAC
jgi:hypothetical protein